MSAAAIRCEGCDRLRASLRVIGSFLAAVVVVGLGLAPFAGPMAVVIPAGALIFGLPSLFVAVAVRAIFDRSIRQRLLAWCLAAPFIAAGTLLAFQYLIDYRRRGYDLASFLSLDSIWSMAGLGLIFASVASAIFYVWESRAGRRLS